MIIEKTIAIAAFFPSTLVIIAATDWGALGTGMAVAFIAAMQYYQLHRSKNRDAAIHKIKTTVEAVHKLTNGNMGEQLKISMISAQTLANLTKLPEHLEMSVAATSKYAAHLETERKLEQAAALANLQTATQANVWGKKET